MSRLPFVLTLVVCLSGSVAFADDKAKALALFEKSDKAYKAGKFEDAVKLLEESYKLFPEPVILYNLGRAQEGMGDVTGAIASYERYLKDAKQIQDRGAIERRVATLKAQVEAKDAEAKRLADEEARRKQAEEDALRAEEERRRAEQERLRIEQQRRDEAVSPIATFGPWITIGVGAVVVGTGAYFGIRASSTHDDAVAAPVQRDALELQTSAERSATIANVLILTGTAAIVVGVSWKIYQWRTAKVTVAPNAVAIGGSW